MYYNYILSYLPAEAFDGLPWQRTLRGRPRQRRLGSLGSSKAFYEGTSKASYKGTSEVSYKGTSKVEALGAILAGAL